MTSRPTADRHGAGVVSQDRQRGRMALQQPLSRLSFRHLLLAAFLLVAGLMAATSLRGLWTLERLTTQSREGAEQAAAVQDAVQVLAERGVAMERAARQYAVLDDPMLRQRFAAAHSDARRQLDALVEGPLPTRAARPWLSQADRIAALVGRGDGAARDAELADAFRQLERIGAAIADRLQAEGQARSRQQLAQLEAGRRTVNRQMAAASVLAGLLAVGFGVALAKPLRRLEASIVELGENRLDKAIEIRGPADIRRIGQQLDWLRQRLAELDADKARFLRQVSHELKTPLAALREGVSLLEEGVTGALNEPQREVARILRENTGRLQAQIEDLLRFNAAAFEARRLVRRPVELRGWLAERIEAQRLQWLARQLVVRVEGPSAVAEIDGDKLATAFGNLLSNAIRFSPPGGEIVVTLATHAGECRISVADAGPGVAESDRAHVFEPFYRGERQPESTLRGSGIGLSIVREIVAAHGGRVELAPSERGARFDIVLPHVRLD